MKTVTTRKFITRLSSLLFIASLVFGMQSCVKDNFDFSKVAEAEWNPNLAVPMIYASMSIEDMLTTDTIEGIAIVEAADKSLSLIYSTTLFTLDASSLVSLPNQNFPSAALPIGAGLTLPFGPGASQIVNGSETVSLLTGPSLPLIDSMTVKNGSFFFSFSSDLANSGSIDITIPSATLNGVPFSETLPLSYSGTTPVLAQSSFDLTGYDFDMTQGVAPYNEFDINFSITIDGSTTAPSIADQIGVTMSMNNIEYSKMFGDMGKLPLSMDTDTMDLSLFTNTEGAGSFSLYDPQIKVTLTNSYGLPINASFSTFQGYNPGVNFYPITGVPDPLPITSPTISEVGESKVGSFQLDRTNSNIATLINNTPKQIILKVDIETNPAGPTQNNFITDTSRLSIDIDLTLPFHGTAANFSLVDSMPFESQGDVPDQVESAVLRLYNSNGFPIDLDLQIYMVDSSYTILDSLIGGTGALLQSGTVSPATGRVTAPTATTFDIILTKAKVEKLKSTRHFIISAAASTTNSGATDVKIYSDYTLDLKLGVQIQLKVDPTNLDIEQ